MEESTTKESTTKESTTKDTQSTTYAPPKITRPPKLFDDDAPSDTQDSTSRNQAIQTETSGYKGPAEKGGILVGENVPGQASKEQPTGKSNAATTQVSGFLLAAVAGVAVFVL